MTGVDASHASGSDAEPSGKLPRKMKRCKQGGQEDRAKRKDDPWDERDLAAGDGTDKLKN